MRLFGGHAVKKAAQGGFARVGAGFDPRDGNANHRAADHGQVQRRGWMAHAAAVLAGDDIQAQMQARFDAPVTTVGLEHCGGAEGRPWLGAEQVLGFDVLGGLFLGIETAGQPGRLFDKGKGDSRSRGVKRDEAAGLGAAPIAFAGLNGGRCDPRGKKRAIGLGRAVARF